MEAGISMREEAEVAGEQEQEQEKRRKPTPEHPTT